MNALDTDQAKRVAEAIYKEPKSLSGVVKRKCHNSRTDPDDRALKTEDACFFADYSTKLYVASIARNRDSTCAPVMSSRA